MTKRHFIALADTIKYSGVHWTNEQIGLLANFCQSCNPCFDRTLWLAYVNGECGSNGGTITRKEGK